MTYKFGDGPIIRLFIRDALFSESLIFGLPRCGKGAYKFSSLRPSLRPSELDLRIHSLDFSIFGIRLHHNKGM